MILQLGINNAKMDAMSEITKVINPRMVMIFHHIITKAMFK